MFFGHLNVVRHLERYDKNREIKRMRGATIK